MSIKFRVIELINGDCEIYQCTYRTWFGTDKWDYIGVRENTELAKRLIKLLINPNTVKRIRYFDHTGSEECGSW